MRMANYRANPDEAHKEFEKLINKIASCVSLEDVKKTSPSLRVKNELVNLYSKILTEATKSVIDGICESVDLDIKLKKLHELEENNVEPAWRPETGKCDILTIKGDHLRKQRKILENNLEQVKKETSELQAEITDRRSRIQEKQAELKKHIRCCQNQEIIE